MPGALMVLVAHGQQNLILDRITGRQHFATESNRDEIIVNSTNPCLYEHTILRNSDTVFIDHLVIKCPNEYRLTNENMNELINKLDTFTIYFDNHNGATPVLFSNKISFYTQLNKPKIINNSLVIKIPFELFTTEIKLIALQYCSTMCKIKTNQPLNFADQPCELSLLYTQKYLDSDERRQMAQMPSIEPIQHIYTDNIQQTEPLDTLTTRINSNGISKGYFLEGALDKIINFKLQLNGHTYIDYDQIMLQMYSTQISENLCFLPFVPQTSYSDRSLETFVGGLNHVRIDATDCIIRFSEPQTTFTIHSMDFNRLKYENGFAHMQISENGGIAFYDVLPQPPQFGFEEQIPTNFSPSPSEIQERVLNWLSENKLIDLTKNDECPINYVKFEPECTFCTCSTCSYNFDADTLKSYFSNNEIEETNCPMCRSHWTEFIVYTNRPANPIADYPITVVDNELDDYVAEIFI